MTTLHALPLPHRRHPEPEEVRCPHDDWWFHPRFTDGCCLSA